MKMGNGLLAVWMQPTEANEAEFNRWYDDEHVPERMALPGFLAARRYTNLREGPKYIALYELDGPDALASAEYQKVRKDPTPLTRKVTGAVTANVRNEYELIKSIGANPLTPAPYLYMVMLETEAEHDDELNQWYDSEHLAALAGVPGVSGARRYRSHHAVPKYLAVYELASPDIPDSDAWHKAADTPWTLKMRPLFKNRQSHLGQLLKATPSA
jgi:hypothetical protein